jgi:Asp-tRNA(Asn)/Glu-tRNA(Gln) amidotransferase A subunit family amidase
MYLSDILPDTSGNNPNYGTPPNSYNRGYYTGGSSSGCAYAVCAGLIPIALGGDGGGSIRIPSSFCSVYGLKPSHGRLSAFPSANHSNTCAVNGPIAADMRSLAALYNVIAEPHSSSRFPSPSAGLVRNPRRILGIPDAWFSRATSEVQDLSRYLIDKLVSEYNYHVVPIEIPFLVEGQIAHAMTVLTDAATLLPQTDNLTAANRILIALGTVTPATDFLLAQKLRQLLMQHLAFLWSIHPIMIIITPTTSCAGWPIKDKKELRYGVSDGDQTLKTMEYVWMANFTGLPALTVPAGFATSKASKSITNENGTAEKNVPVGLMGMAEWATRPSCYNGVWKLKLLILPGTVCLQRGSTSSRLQNRRCRTVAQMEVMTTKHSC